MIQELAKWLTRSPNVPHAMSRNPETETSSIAFHLSR